MGLILKKCLSPFLVIACFLVSVGNLLSLPSFSSPEKAKRLLDATSFDAHLRVSENSVANTNTKSIEKKNHELESNVFDLIDNILHEQNIGEWEVILTSFIPSLLREGIVPEGIIFDVGAQFGEQAAHYAVTAPGRQVMAMDPSPRNVARMKQNYGDLPNLIIKHGGVGKTVGRMKPRDRSFQMNLNADFPLFTLDSLFFDKGQRLALLHLDVEGLELDVLEGGLKTIREYQPIMTTEVRVHQDPEYTKSLLNLLDKEGYDSYVINEVCGFPHMDYRNLFNIPRKLRRTLSKSDSAMLLFNTEALSSLPVTSDNIFQEVLPCCALGEKCCPGNDINHPSCCSEENVMDWNEANNVHVMAAANMWHPAHKTFLTFKYRLNKRAKNK